MFPLLLPPWRGQRSATAVPDTWQRIIGYMREHPGPKRPVEVQEALGLVVTPRYAMSRMVERGMLRRLEPEVYVVRETISGEA